MNRNFSNTGLIPPIAASDGFANQPRPEPKTLAEELAEETSLVRQSALKDAVFYIVSNAVHGTDIDVKKAINIRHNLKFTDCDAIVSKAKTLAVIEIKKAKANLDELEKQHAQFEDLSALFTAIGLQIQFTDNGRYTLTGLSKIESRLIAEVLVQERGE